MSTAAEQLDQMAMRASESTHLHPGGFRDEYNMLFRWFVHERDKRAMAMAKTPYTLAEMREWKWNAQEQILKELGIE